MDKIQLFVNDMISHAEGAATLATDEHYIKQVKQYCKNDDDYLTPSSMILLGSGMACVLFSLNIVFFVVGAFIASGFGAYAVKQKRLLIDQAVKNKFFKKGSDTFKVKNSLPPASLEYKVSVVENARQLDVQQHIPDLVRLAQRDDIPNGWWVILNDQLMREIKHQKKEQRKNKEVYEQVLIERLDDIEKETQYDTIERNKGNKSINI